MVELVWLKRDLRVQDHAPLRQASISGAAVCLYVIEPGITDGPDMDAQHWRWIASSLRQLRRELKSLHIPLWIREGDVVDVLDDIHRRHTIHQLHSHQETGVDRTYQRDKRVAEWCAREAVTWIESRQQAVVRGHLDRDRWTRDWESFMREDPIPAPKRIDLPASLAREPIGRIPSASQVGLTDLTPAVGRRGDHGLDVGERDAWACLHSFFEDRGRAYHKEMSSPLTAWSSCSRLSPYLAWGNISIRDVVKQTWAAIGDHKTRRANKDNTAFPGTALSAFRSRLHWHCHFVQKLENEPEIEFHCFHRGFDDIREDGNDPDRLLAWQEGKTGFPFVDACMRNLQSTGWINFRMRAMLVAFASYHLWIDWRRFRDFLARQFIDYEPGIHISQLQMQSGVTGINSVRVYNPVKQGYDQDPSGEFVRTWVPELRALDAEWIQEPWQSPLLLDPSHYPSPIVDHVAASKEAQRKIYARRREPAVKDERKRVYERHGSRKRPPRRKPSSKKSPQDKTQLSLDI